MCPKCGRHLDDTEYITCSECRRNNSNKRNELRHNAMEVFGIGVKKQEQDIKPETDWKEEILRNIALTGTASAIDTKHVISTHGQNINHILNLTSGRPRLQTNIIKRFDLILEQPRPLEILNPFEIRCCLCRKVISYPCWYYSIRYAVNHFHYFICFQATPDSPEDKPSTRCYRRE